MVTPTKSLRSTKQRQAIQDAFSAQNRPLSPKEILDIAGKQIENLGIATVYRNIKLMVEKKELTPISIPGQADRYYLPMTEKKPLFLCTKTNKAYFIEPKCIKTHISHLPAHLHPHHSETIIYGESKNH